MRLLQYHIIFILLTLGSVRAQTMTEPRVNWLTFEQLEDSLAVQPKPVLLFFHTEWCSYCKKMMRETFTNESVVNSINQNYYAVEFDAESVQEVAFDGVVFRNESRQKRTGQYHDLVKLLLGKNKRPTFPFTILLNADFSVKSTNFNYLSVKQILKIL